MLCHLIRMPLRGQREPNRGETHERAQRNDVEMVEVASVGVWFFVATRSGLSSTPISTAIGTMGTRWALARRHTHSAIPTVHLNDEATHGKWLFGYILV